MQSRQRHSFIQSVNQCQLPYGLKERALEYLSLLESSGVTFSATVYEPAVEITFISGSSITNLDLPEAHTFLHHDINDSKSNINTHITIVFLPSTIIFLSKITSLIQSIIIPVSKQLLQLSNLLLQFRLTLIVSIKF